MGTVVAMIETLIGEVRESPQRKRIWSSLDAEERGDEQSAQVAPGDPFAREEGGCQPEEQKSPDQTIDRQGEMVEPLRVLGREKDGLADRGVQSPDDIGQQQGSVPFERLRAPFD